MAVFTKIFEREGFPVTHALPGFFSHRLLIHLEIGIGFGKRKHQLNLSGTHSLPPTHPYKAVGWVGSTEQEVKCMHENKSEACK